MPDRPIAFRSLVVVMGQPLMDGAGGKAKIFTSGPGSKRERGRA
jgi:hypothetical protein